MTALTPIPFEIPDSRRPRKVRGFVCIAFAGEKMYSGCDSNDSEDAYWNMVDCARRDMVTSVTVDKDFDPAIDRPTVRMYQIPSDGEPSVELLEVGDERA